MDILDTSHTPGGHLKLFFSQDILTTTPLNGMQPLLSFLNPTSHQTTALATSKLYFLCQCSTSFNVRRHCHNSLLQTCPPGYFVWNSQNELLFGASLKCLSVTEATRPNLSSTTITRVWMTTWNVASTACQSQVFKDSSFCFLLQVSKLIPLWPESLPGRFHFFLNLLRFDGWRSGLTWWMLHRPLERKVLLCCVDFLIYIM